MNYYLSKLMTYHEVHKMYREGNSIRKISDHLGLNWRTVKKLLSKDDRSYQKELEAPSSKKKLLDPYRDRKSTRLNSSHVKISYAVFCLKKKKISKSKLPT